MIIAEITAAFQRSFQVFFVVGKNSLGDVSIFESFFSSSPQGVAKVDCLFEHFFRDILERKLFYLGGLKPRWGSHRRQSVRTVGVLVVIAGFFECLDDFIGELDLQELELLFLWMLCAHFAVPLRLPRLECLRYAVFLIRINIFSVAVVHLFLNLSEP